MKNLKLFLTLMMVAVMGCGQMWGTAASLPFEYDGNGASNLPDGLTVSGTETYTNSPKIKFNTEGDFVKIEFSDVPNKLTFDIKGNPGSGTTLSNMLFEVAESEDDITYTTIKSYTSLTNTVSDNDPGELSLSSSTRFVKFTLVTKTGNVGLGNISISKMPKFSVTYNANGGTGDAPTDATLYDPNAQVTVLGKGNLERTGCTFAGWNTKADGSGTSYAANETFSISANTTLYAKWTATVTWKANNVIVKTDNIVVPADGKEVSLPTAEQIGANKCGDRVMGWTESANHKANTAPADLFTAAPTVQGNKTYYAVFADYAE